MRKQDAHEMIDRMGPDATWEDLMHEIYVRKAIEKGLEDSQAGRTQDVEELRAEFGLSE
ncbi:MAG: hypothetical protein AAF560_32545 [Acidobacteriota bacterium]